MPILFCVAALVTLIALGMAIYACHLGNQIKTLKKESEMKDFFQVKIKAKDISDKDDDVAQYVVFATYKDKKTKKKASRRMMVRKDCPELRKKGIEALISTMFDNV